MRERLRESERERERDCDSPDSGRREVIPCNTHNVAIRATAQGVLPCSPPLADVLKNGFE